MKKLILIGSSIYILGYILVVFSSSIVDSGVVENSYYYGIIFSILYLSAIVGVSTLLILKELRKIQNH